MGPSSVLNQEKEKLLVDWIVASAKIGFPLKRKTLFESVQKIIDLDKRPNPFTNGTPGEKWFKGFLRRNPSIAERRADPIKKARATVTEPAIRKWFDELYEYFQDEDSLDILQEPRRIFNSDESGFQTCPATGKVLGPVSYNNFYEIKMGKDKEQLTVLATFNAAGETIPGSFPAAKDFQGNCSERPR